MQGIHELSFVVSRRNRKLVPGSRKYQRHRGLPRSGLAIRDPKVPIWVAGLPLNESALCQTGFEQLLDADSSSPFPLSKLGLEDFLHIRCYSYEEVEARAKGRRSC